jgi:hypothetical protein
VSHQDLHDREIAADRAKQRYDPAFQRFCRARNGDRIGRRRVAGKRQW